MVIPSVRKVEPAESSVKILTTGQARPDVYSHFCYTTPFIPILFARQNDAFVANGDPRAFLIFDQSEDELVDVSFCVPEALDAGTEVNDEI